MLWSCVQLRSLKLRGRDDVRERHSQKQEHNQAEIHPRHGQPTTRRHLEVAALFVTFLAEQGPQPGQREEENEADEEVRKEGDAAMC